MKILQHDFYDKLDVWIQTCNGFLYPSFGFIDLLAQLCGKIVKTTFVVVHTFDQFQVKLGLPWLNSMHVVASPIHKCLNFFYDDEVKIVNHSLCHTSGPRDSTTIVFF